MSRSLTVLQKALLRSDHVCNILATFYLDEGTYRFCDDTSDLSDGTNTYISAGTIVESLTIASGSPLAAEPSKLRIDGQRMADFGVSDPGAVLKLILNYVHTNRRVDFALGFRYPDSPNIQLIVPMMAAKINNCFAVDPAADPDKGPSFGYVDITLDSLAMRYNQATFRTRSAEDQKEIDPTDEFYSFTSSIVESDRSIWWGKAAPYGSGGSGVYGGGYFRDYPFNEN